MQQIELLQFALDILERLGIPYMLVGSYASGVYGEPRLTLDIDIVIAPSEPQLRSLCSAFPQDEFYVSADAALAALQLPNGQFNVIHPETSYKIDFMIARTDPWGREQLARRQRVEVLRGQQGFVARPEDVIISKMLYYQEGGSEKHLRDIAGILRVSGQFVDRDYVQRWSVELGLEDIWDAILARLRA